MSTLSLRKIKHDSSSVDNVTLNTDGGVGLGGIDPSTLPSFIDHAVKVQNGGGLGIQSANATDNRWIFFGTGTSSADVQKAGIVNQGSDQSLGLATAGTQRLIVDSSGRVTKPYQPAFFAVRTSGGQVSYNSIIAFQSAEVNTGNVYNTSNNRFTAPVSGRYFIQSKVQFSNGTTQYYAGIALKVNGTLYSESYTNQYTTDAHAVPVVCVLIQLNAGDYVEVFMAQFQSGTNPIIQGSATERRSVFMGYLVG